MSKKKSKSNSELNRKVSELIARGFNPKSILAVLEFIEENIIGMNGSSSDVRGAIMACYIHSLGNLEFLQEHKDGIKDLNFDILLAVDLQILIEKMALPVYQK